MAHQEAGRTMGDHEPLDRFPKGIFGRLSHTQNFTASFHDGGNGGIDEPVAEVGQSVVIDVFFFLG